MRKLIEHMLVSLDGVCTGPEVMRFSSTATTPTSATAWANSWPVTPC